MKGSIFMSEVSPPAASALLQDNEAPGRAAHLGALSPPDGDTQTEQLFSTMDRDTASPPAVCAEGSSSSRWTLIYSSTTWKISL